jgi:hypothetical protein
MIERRVSSLKRWMLLAALAFSIGSCRDVAGPGEPAVPGPPRKILPSTGDGQIVVAGSPTIPLSVLVTDENGTPVPDVAVAFDIRYSYSIGTSSRIRAVKTGADGVARLDGWSVPAQAGTYLVEAWVVTGVTYTFTLKSVVGPPAQLNLWVYPTKVSTGTPLTARLTVFDAGYNALVGVPATFSIEGAGASVAAAQVTTNSSEGGASTTWTLGSTLGMYSLKATVGTLSATVTAEAVSGPPASITRVAGDTQTVTVFGTVRTPLKVLVVDAAGLPVPAAKVQWSADAGTTSGCGTTVTDTLGTATCAGWRISQVGTFGLAAELGTSSTRFTARALALPSSFAFVSVPDSLTEVRTDTELPGDVVVEVRMGDGSPAVGYPVSFTTSGGEASGPVAVTDATGRASTRWRTSPTPGRTTLTATLDGAKTIVTPVRTFGPPTFSISPNETFNGIFPGRSHTCGITMTEWSILCWGSNSVGQAGGPVGGADGLLPGRFSGWSGAGYSSFSSLGDHSCMRQVISYGRSGSVTTLRCWGLAPDGSQTYTVPTEVPLTSYRFPELTETALNGAMTSRTDGALHACAVSSMHSIFCVGRNDHGQLGDGTTTDRTVPVAVIGGATEWSSVAVVLGESHSCARSSAGGVYCWGRNDAGQLGDGTTVDRATPAAVSGGVAFTSLVAGVAHTCGLTAAGIAYCWGSNADGQLGIGTIGGNAAVPQLVAGGRTFVAIAVGDHHSCGVIANGLAFCWGRNDHGQLGDGTRTNRGAPTPMGDYHPRVDAP